MPVSIKDVRTSYNASGGYDVTVEIDTGYGVFSATVKSHQKSSNSAINDVQQKLYEMAKDMASKFEDPVGKLVTR